MTDEKDDGGPAFPRFGGLVDGPNSPEWIEPQPSMSLRDYFAAHAPITFVDALALVPSAIIGNDRDRCIVLAVFAKLQYDYADAMLAERKKMIDEIKKEKAK